MNQNNATTGKRAHAKHSPSSLGYKEQCPAFSGRPGSNAAADEGTMLHEALETDIYDGLTEEQSFICGLCRDFRDGELERLSTLTTKVHQYRELPLTICNGLTRGTADFVAIAGDEGILIDYKFGRGHVEPAATNAQGCAYCLGTFERFPELRRLTLHFVQPRAELISTHTYVREQDMPAMQLRVETIIRRANARNKEEHPSLACCYCRKQATCTALRRIALPIAARYAEDTSLALTPEDELHPSRITSPELMSRCLTCAKVLKEWVESVTYHALLMAKEGTDVPGYKLMTRAGRRSVTDAAAAYAASGLDAATFIRCCGTVSLDALTEAASAKAPKGQKAKIKDELLSRLAEEGILTTGAPSQYLKRLQTKTKTKKGE